jgi:hypothetical protein
VPPATHHLVVVREEKYEIAIDSDPALHFLFRRAAGAATCGGDFGTFLLAMSREAAAAGISRTVTDSAFARLTEDGSVLAFDRRQRGTFRKSHPPSLVGGGAGLAAGAEGRGGSHSTPSLRGAKNGLRARGVKTCREHFIPSVSLNDVPTTLWLRQSRPYFRTPFDRD